MDSMNYYGNRFTTFGTRAVDSQTRAYGFDIDEDRRELLREFARKLEEGFDRYYENLLAGFDRAFEAVKEKYNSEKNFETIEEGSKGQPVVGDESSSEEKSVEADVVEEEEKQESERESMGIFEDLKMPSVSESSEMKRPTKAEAVKEEEKLEEPESELTRAYGSGGYELNLEYGDQGTNYGSEYGAGIPVLQLCKVGHSGGVNQIRARPHVIVSWADTGQVQFDAHEDERFAIDWGPPISGKLMSVHIEVASPNIVKTFRVIEKPLCRCAKFGQMARNDSRNSRE